MRSVTCSELIKKASALSKSNPELVGNDISSSLLDSVDDYHKLHTYRNPVDMYSLATKYEEQNPRETQLRNAYDKMFLPSVLSSTGMLAAGALIHEIGGEAYTQPAITSSLLGAMGLGNVYLQDRVWGEKSPWDPNARVYKKLHAIENKATDQVNAKRRGNLIQALQPKSAFRKDLARYQAWLNKNDYTIDDYAIPVGKDLVGMLKRHKLLDTKYTHDLDIDKEVSRVH